MTPGWGNRWGARSNKNHTKNNPNVNLDRADQKWTLTHLSNGQYQILNTLSGTFMEVYYAKIEDGTKIEIWPWNGNNCQKWTITPSADGFFKLTAVHSGKVADVNGGSTADGATIIQWPYGGATNQQWSISTTP